MPQRGRTMYKGSQQQLPVRPRPLAGSRVYDPPTTSRRLGVVLRVGVPVAELLLDGTLGDAVRPRRDLATAATSPVLRDAAIGERGHAGWRLREVKIGSIAALAHLALCLLLLLASVALLLASAALPVALLRLLLLRLLGGHLLSLRTALGGIGKVGLNATNQHVLLAARLDGVLLAEGLQVLADCERLQLAGPASPFDLRASCCSSARLRASQPSQ